MFEIPTRGPVLGIQCLENGTTIVVSRSAGLEIILVDMQRGVYVNLDPYIMVAGNGDVEIFANRNSNFPITRWKCSAI